MRIRDVYGAGRPVFSFEFFPPKTEKGEANLMATCADLQAAVHDLTADAIIAGSRELVLQALLVDPVVDKVEAASTMLDTMIALQPEYLGYLR